MSWRCFAFGHLAPVKVPGPDGYWYFRCPRCLTWMGSVPMPARLFGVTRAGERVLITEDTIIDQDGYVQ